MIDIPEVTHIKLSSLLLPFISLGRIIPPMKMIMQCIANKPFPIPHLPMLKNIQILLKLMLNDCPSHDLIMQL